MVLTDESQTIKSEQNRKRTVQTYCCPRNKATLLHHAHSDRYDGKGSGLGMHAQLTSMEDGCSTASAGDSFYLSKKTCPSFNTESSVETG